MKIVSPRYDFVVKELFRNETVLKYFIGDVLGIPQDQIRTIRLKNTFLRTWYRRQKLGILDILVDLNDDTKIDIELQIKVYDNWDKRLLFYLARLFTEDLQTGQNYSLLRKCVGISILNFNLSEREEYHSTYYLMDEKGNRLSDMLEVHILELKKKVNGHGDIENWIRFFNIETEEDMRMIKTKNPGILEAIGLLQRMSMNSRLRQKYEA
ncbi:MAG: Rpn family recombination-promoting nuclease/putative transposase, partial [Hungatella sp.]|nr:Rpn family recombination-promoting nuclease/putative transposase [Hungatella sp.]